MADHADAAFVLKPGVQHIGIDPEPALTH